MSDKLTSKTIKELIEKIDGLTSVISTLTTTLAAQTKMIEAQTVKIDAQTKTIDAQTKKIDAQTGTISEQAAINYKLKEKIKVQEERLNKNSNNSSKPPSSDGLNKPNPKSQRKPSGKSPGAQNGHKGNGFKLMKEPDETVLYHPDQCVGCPNFGICKVCGISETKYDVDICVETKVTAHQVLSYECPFKSNRVISGSFPSNVKSTMQYGDNLEALVIALNTSGMMGIKRTHNILSAVFGIPISTGTIFSMVKDCGLKLKDTVERIRQTLCDSPSANFDETGLRVNKKLHWVHSASTALFTYLSVEEKRGTIGMDSSGVLPYFSGVAIHDFWKPYFKYVDVSHAMCNAHLIRELTGIVENNPNQAWALEAIELLLQMKKAKEVAISREQHSLSDDCLKYFTKKYDNIFEKAIAQNPLKSKTGKRGRPKKGEIRALVDRFVEYKGEICLFVNDFSIPFTNNLAEQDIRMIKVKQKVSGCFRTKTGADTFVTIMSYIGTASKQGINAYSAIKSALANQSQTIIFD
jgi:transposase